MKRHNSNKRFRFRSRSRCQLLQYYRVSVANGPYGFGRGPLAWHESHGEREKCEERKLRTQASIQGSGVYEFPHLQVRDQTIYRSDNQISLLSPGSAGNVVIAFSFASNSTKVEIDGCEKKLDEFTIALICKEVDAMLESCNTQKNTSISVQRVIRKVKD